MNTNEAIIRKFIAAWSGLNASELVEYFTVDGVYFNIPVGPVAGHDNLLQFIGAFIGNWTSTEWEILNIMSQGDLVMVERMDRTRMGEKSVDLPCIGVFELEAGKIKVWRDYFDMGTYTRAVG